MLLCCAIASGIMLCHTNVSLCASASACASLCTRQKRAEQSIVQHSSDCRVLQDNRAPFLSSQHGNVFQSVSSRCAKQVEPFRFRIFSCDLVPIFELVVQPRVVKIIGQRN